jgi:hypothetical protein
MGLPMSLNRDGDATEEASSGAATAVVVWNREWDLVTNI